MKTVPTQQKLIAELEAQIGRPVTEEDLACVDVNEEGQTITVARNPLLAEIRIKEGERHRGLDLDSEKRLKMGGGDQPHAPT